MIKPRNCAPETTWQTFDFNVAGTTPAPTNVFDTTRAIIIREVHGFFDSGQVATQDTFIEFGIPAVPDLFGKILAVTPDTIPGTYFAEEAYDIFIPAGSRLHIRLFPNLSATTLICNFRFIYESFVGLAPRIGGTP